MATDGNVTLEPEKPGNALDDGGFSSAVGPQKNGNLDAVNLETDIVVGQIFSVVFCHVIER